MSRVKRIAPNTPSNFTAKNCPYPIKILMQIADYAKYRNVSLHTMYDYVKSSRQRIKGIKISGLVYVDIEEADRYFVLHGRNTTRKPKPEKPIAETIETSAPTEKRTETHLQDTETP